MKVAVLKESYPNERRVALIPANVPQLAKLGMKVLVEQGAGLSAGIPDQHYFDKGASLIADRAELFGADILLQVRCFSANREAGKADLPWLSDKTVVVGMCDPLGAPAAIAEMAQTRATVFALEMIPRITRAQTMDVLSSQATVAGYRAVLLAAGDLPKMFPMMMTAAGTLAAARVFVIGAGVAGLQAIATARRMGAVVHAYDVRPATREQVESLGGKFVALELEAGQSEDQGGYAKSMGDAFYEKQRQLMTSVVIESDVVIATAAIPGQPSPLLITAAAVEGMAAGQCDCRSGGGARRQLRAESTGCAGGRARRGDLWSHQSFLRHPLPCQPDVLEQHHQVSGQHGQGGTVELESGRRDHSRYAGLPSG